MLRWLSLPKEELEDIIRMLRNPKAPMGPKVIVALLFLYIIWPADLVPDFVIPVLGWADDLGFFGLTVWWLRKEVKRLSRKS